VKDLKPGYATLFSPHGNTRGRAFCVEKTQERSAQKDGPNVIKPGMNPPKKIEIMQKST
jgi:hypothetical protein